MSYDDALNLSFIYRSKIRIISPDNLKNSIITELLKLNETYLRQSIITKFTFLPVIIKN